MGTKFVLFFLSGLYHRCKLTLLLFLSVFFYLLHTEYQFNTFYWKNEDIFGIEDMLTCPHNFKGLFEDVLKLGLELGLG